MSSEERRAARRAYSKAYYRKNRERMLAEQKVRDQQREALAPGARSQYQEAYREANRETLLEKQRARGKVLYAASKAKHKARARKAKLKRYGLTEDQHRAVLQRQEYQCPICERFLAYPTVASIDHCHTTGSVRGVLCRRCNTALGLLEESPANLERALEYLSIPRLQSFNRWLSGATSMTSSEPSSEPSQPPE